MPKRQPTYGDESKKRVRCLLEKLLAYVYEELDKPEDYKIQFRWETPKQVIVTAKRTELQKLTGLESAQVRCSQQLSQGFFDNLLRFTCK